MRGLTLAIVMAVSTSAAADPWTAGDTFVEAGVALTLGADYLQTRQICAWQDSHPGDWRLEANPAMGPTCERLPPSVYFPLALAAHAVIARTLPRPLRRVWQGVTIAVELGSLDRNARAGFSIRF